MWRLKTESQAGNPGTVLKSSNLGNLGNPINNLMSVESSWRRLKMRAQAGEPGTALKSSNLGNLGNPIDFSKNLERM